MRFCISKFRSSTPKSKTSQRQTYRPSTAGQYPIRHPHRITNMSSPTLTFFGATGDCAGYCLAYTLKAGYTCTALARTPGKLTASMTTKGVSSETLASHLTIIEGNVRDVEAVKRTLQSNGRVTDYIVSGIGGTPKLQASLMEPVTLNDPTICQDAMATILEALKLLQPVEKPILLNVSTTGIWPEDKPRDVPLPYLPLYKWFLHVPHEDKRVLEENLTAHMRLPEGERLVQGFVHIKPSLLTGDKGYGLDKVKFGVDEAPAVGYGMAKEDVGEWMFERLIKPGVSPEWVNKSISLTF